MIQKFNTAVSIPGGGESKINPLVVVAVLVVAGFLVYKFVIKPAQDKAKADELHSHKE